MKKLILIAILAALPASAFAYNPLETREHANQRHASERYEARERNSDNPFYQSSGTFGDPRGDSSRRNRF